MGSMGVLSLPFLPTFSASQESTLPAAWGLLEPEKLRYWTDESKTCIDGACKTAQGCARVFYKYYGCVRAGSLELTPGVPVRCLLVREPWAQADAAGFALCPEESLFS